MAYKNPADQAAAARRHYEANKEVMKARAVTHRKQQRKRIAAFTREAKDRPCADCGVRYPYYVMQFDHISDKSFNIGEYSKKSVSLARIRREVEKSEVVSANCHAERTHQRGYHSSIRVTVTADPDRDDSLTLF